jgi:signal transduction histidine kinase
LTPDGAFRGVAAVSVHVDYFERFFQNVVGSTGLSLELMRDDGRVLATFSPRASSGESDDRHPSAQRANEAVGQSPRYTNADELTLVRAVSGYPIVLIYHIPQSVIFAAWSKDFAVYGLVALFSASILSSVAYIAIRGHRRERAAVAAWQREQLKRLGAEADARRLSKYEALGTLAGGIAHHFNNLFPALTGHLEIAMEEVGTASPAQPRLQRLLKEVGGARTIIRDILLFSRREITAFWPVDLGAVAAQSVDLFRPALADSAELKTDIRRGVHVLGDPMQLSQLVTNLLSNAYDALPSGRGTIALSVGVSDAPHTSDTAVWPAAARLACSDTGSGMSAEVLERAFDPFFTTKPLGRGSGLGLSICDGIVRSHGGHIAIESAVGRGTTVTVLFPATAGAER